MVIIAGTPLIIGCWALQVKVQTVPGFANGLMDGMPKFIQQEGFAG